MVSLAFIGVILHLNYQKESPASVFKKLPQMIIITRTERPHSIPLTVIMKFKMRMPFIFHDNFPYND